MWAFWVSFVIFLAEPRQTLAWWPLPTIDRPRSVEQPAIAGLIDPRPVLERREHPGGGHSLDAVRRRLGRSLGAWSFGMRELLGIEQARAWSGGRLHSSRLKTGLLYRWVPHPMYVGVCGLRLA
jgi:hypothetical protein